MSNRKGFIRSFSEKRMKSLMCKENLRLFEKLNADIALGEVFPAARADTLDFYHAGGVLFRFNGESFKRNPNYSEDSGKKKSGFVSEKTYGKNFSECYDEFKLENKAKFLGKSGDKSKERQILDRLNRNTFVSNNSNVVVIDVEININEYSGKKCDMVLLNIATAQIMFVEGKIYQNGDLGGDEPAVIKQVCGYNQTNERHKAKIESAYSEHIRIVNQLFGKCFPTVVSLVLPTKLIVYNDNAEHAFVRKVAIEAVHSHIGESNVRWNCGGYEPTLDEIWDKLYCASQK